MSGRMTLTELLTLLVQSSSRQFYAHIIATGHENVHASSSIYRPDRAWCMDCDWSWDSPVSSLTVAAPVPVSDPGGNE